MKHFFLSILVCTIFPMTIQAQGSMTVMFYNTENLFDTVDNPDKADDEFTPEGSYRWSAGRYWAKLNSLSKVIAAVDEDTAPALVGLAEVENDTVLSDLTSRAALREAGYRFVMTDSPDRRGIDVALLYRRTFFQYISHECIRVDLSPQGGSPTRDILHVTGRLENHDTLDVYVCHWPSRIGGEKETEPLRMIAAGRVRQSVDSVFSVRRKPYVIIMGDLNEGPDSPAVRQGLAAVPYASDPDMEDRHLMTMMDCLEDGSYKYQGRWDCYDQFVVSASLMNGLGCTGAHDVRICAFDFLLEDDDTYGGRKPKRTYNGRRHQGGCSDHLPVCMTISF